MGEGGIVMEHRDSWTATSLSFEPHGQNDLSALVGVWNEGLEVIISMPAIITKNPATQCFLPAPKPSFEPPTGAELPHA